MRIASLLFIALTHAQIAFATQELPAEAKAILHALPGQALSVEYVIQKAISSSDSYRSVVADETQIESQELQAYAPLDYQTYLKGQKLVNKNETVSSFSPSQTTSTSGAVGVSTLFRSGTAISAELSSGQTDLKYASLPTANTKYYETKASLTLSQSLWKDAFGHATRKGLKAGEFFKKAAQENVSLNKENWFIDLANVYYQAWLAQARTLSSQSHLARRDRLYQITSIKVQRGTSERPDLLQVESAKINSQVDFDNLHQQLKSIWVDLVVTLKFPKEWAEINPLLIPLKLNDNITQAAQLCGSSNHILPAPESSTNVRLSQYQAQAALYRAEQYSNLKSPDLKILGSLVSNGIHATKLNESLTEARKYDHPQWVIGLNLSFPLMQYAEQAQYLSAAAQREKTQAIADQNLSLMQSGWQNTCRDLFTTEKNHDLLLKSQDKQRLRAELEERRFRNGQIPPITVIQAGDDATLAELKVHESEIKRRQISWQILKMSDKIKSELDRLRGAP